MNRIDDIFADLRHKNQKALMPFITAGDPDMQTTAALLPALEQAGASIVELGIPFSDPIADGPVIQQSMTSALNNGITLEKIFSAVSKVRPQTNLGLVAMVSYSIVFKYEPEKFALDAAQAGFDGLIIPDLPIEEAIAMKQTADQAGLKLVMLIAPTTSLDRAKKIAALSSGFVYVVARAGITGEQKTLPQDLPEHLKALRQATNLPLCVGFGISSAEHVKQVVHIADAAIVGSALVRRIDKQKENGKEQIVGCATEFVKELATGLS